MSLLTICQNVARSSGFAVPTSIAGNTERTTAVLLSLANEAGEELARRVDWGALTQSVTLTGTGANVTHALPADFARAVKGVCVKSAGNIVRPLTRAEWGTLDPVGGVPRYFLLEGAEITLWPYLENSATAEVTYQSKNWSSSGQEFTADEDTALFDEDVLAKFLEVRYRRVQGMAYADQEAEAEAALLDFAGFDGRNRL